MREYRHWTHNLLLSVLSVLSLVPSSPTNVAASPGATRIPAAQPPPRIDSPPPTAPWPGEGMTYEIFFGPLQIGRAALVVGRPATRRDATVTVRGRAEVLPLAGKLFNFSEEQLTTVHLETLRPLRSTLMTRKHGTLQKTVTRYATARSQRTEQEIVKGAKTKRRRTRRLPGQAVDPFSALLRLRGGKMLQLGQREQLTVLAGTKLYQLDVTVTASESITVESKQQPALRLEGTAQRITDRGRPLRQYQPTKITLWLSRDRNRVPLAARLRNQHGRFELRLSSYQRPSRSQRSNATRHASDDLGHIGSLTLATISIGPTRPTGSRLRGASRP